MTLTKKQILMGAGLSSWDATKVIRDLTYNMVACPACGGTGLVNMTATDGSEDKCALCDGIQAVPEHVRNYVQDIQRAHREAMGKQTHRIIVLERRLEDAEYRARLGRGGRRRV